MAKKQVKKPTAKPKKVAENKAKKSNQIDYKLLRLTDPPQLADE